LFYNPTPSPQFLVLTMGSKQAAAKRAPAARRATGQWKTAKKNEDPVTSTPVRARPKPRPIPRLGASAAPIEDIPEEEEPINEGHDISLHDIADSFHLNDMNAPSGFEPGLGEDLLADVDYQDSESESDSDSGVIRKLLFFLLFFPLCFYH
jgi:hypothetical protein